MSYVILILMTVVECAVYVLDVYISDVSVVLVSCHVHYPSVSYCHFSRDKLLVKLC